MLQHFSETKTMKHKLKDLGMIHMISAKRYIADVWKGLKYVNYLADSSKIIFLGMEEFVLVSYPRIISNNKFQ